MAATMPWTVTVMMSCSIASVAASPGAVPAPLARRRLSTSTVMQYLAQPINAESVSPTQARQSKRVMAVPCRMLSVSQNGRRASTARRTTGSFSSRRDSPVISRMLSMQSCNSARSSSPSGLACDRHKAVRAHCQLGVALARCIGLRPYRRSSGTSMSSYSLTMRGSALARTIWTRSIVDRKKGQSRYISRSSDCVIESN